MDQPTTMGLATGGEEGAGLWMRAHLASLDAGTSRVGRLGGGTPEGFPTVSARLWAQHPPQGGEAPGGRAGAPGAVGGHKGGSPCGCQEAGRPPPSTAAHPHMHTGSWSPAGPGRPPGAGPTGSVVELVGPAGQVVARETRPLWAWRRGSLTHRARRRECPHHLLPSHPAGEWAPYLQWKPSLRAPLPHPHHPQDPGGGPRASP